ncbi:MAG: dTDP-4-dehydrorhamnose reductase [Terriglobales bacterium]
MTVAIIGANGQLGMDVVAAFQESGERTAGLTHADLDVSSLASTRKILSSVLPSIIVNTAAMHHVEDCEKEPGRAYEINALGAQNVSIVAKELNAKLVHISTDYVFDGLKKTPYVETDATAPLNVYGKSKLAGETFIRQTPEKYFVVRTSALYGRNPCRAKGGRNFVDLMLTLAGERDELRVVDDEMVSPTSTTELAKQIALLSRTDSYGLYHATAEGSCSWYEFARTIFETTNTRVNLKVAAPGEFPSKVPRPKYSVLENRGLKTLSLNSFRSWQEGLAVYLSGSSRAA